VIVVARAGSRWDSMVVEIVKEGVHKSQSNEDN